MKSIKKGLTLSEVSTLKKYKIILEEFEKRDDSCLTGYDEVLRDKLELSPKQIDRLIKELSFEFDNIVELEGYKRKTYKLLQPIDLFVEAFEKFDDLGWFFSMANDADPEIFVKLQELTNPDKSIYKFQNSPFEDLKILEDKAIFKSLKRAIKNREYVKIKYKHTKEVYDNLKCLKLLFIDNNWYIAFIDNQEKIRLSRISFIESVNYATTIESYQISTVKKQLNFIDNKLQNSMTLYATDIKKATIKASPAVARYFEKDMKKFLSTQKFKEKLEDGSVIFSLDYTQPIEILPFIQNWMPELIILEPKELIEEYLKNLNSSINNYLK